MKNKKLLGVLALVVILSASMVFAYMLKQTQTEENTFIPAAVSCRVDEKFDNTTKSEITITNTGNYKAYLRVRLVTYWVKEDGSVVFRQSAAIPDFTFDNTKWIKDADENTYYYKFPVDPTYSTPDLLEPGTITLKTETEKEITYRQVIDVFAEAILAETVGTSTGPIADVVTAWHATVDSNGTITKIK